MARISGVEPAQANLFTRFFYWMTKRKIGRVVVPIKVTAHHTGLLWGMGQMEMAQLGLKSVSPSLKALAGIQVAKLIGCPF